MSVFDGLILPGQVGATIFAGFKQGQQEREEREGKSALAAFAINPDDDVAFEHLARARPELAIQVGQQRAASQREAETRRLTALAAQGDKAAMAQLAGIDFNAFDKLSDNQRAQAKQENETIAQAALWADTPEKWDAQVERLGQLGMDVSQYRGRFDLRETVLAQAGQMKTLLEMNEPRYQAIPEGGTLVNTRDPAAVAGFARGQGSGPAPQSTGGPAPGAVVGGYRFKGGDPNDKSSWEPAGAGGRTANLSATFRPVGISGERVTSTFRTAGRNQAVGGKTNSYHLSGRARDSVPPPGMSMAAYAAELRRLNPHLEVINEGDHVHMEPR